MKFYIATSLKNAAQAKKLSEMLESNADFKNIFPWFDIQTSNDELTNEELLIFAQNEIAAAVECDLFINIFSLSRGCHVELGAALASAQNNDNKHIYLWSEKEENYLSNPSVFYYHPNVNCQSGEFDNFSNLIIQTFDNSQKE